MMSVNCHNWGISWLKGGQLWGLGHSSVGLPLVGDVVRRRLAVWTGPIQGNATRN